MRVLEKLKVTGFKSIREQELALRRLNVFIGGNGSGKSNLIGVFRFLKEIVNQNLAGYTQLKGGADALLHHGRKRSPHASIDIAFGENTISNRYYVRVAGSEDDRLFISEETAFYHQRAFYPKPYDWHIASNVAESLLVARRHQHVCPAQIFQDLENYRVYHFHDTSDFAPAKASSDVDDNRFFRPQAENIASFLYYLQQQKFSHFRLIQDTVRQIAPFFGGFRLEPSRLNPNKVRLEWFEPGSDTYFNAAALSDGTLRFICLAVLLLQPDLPSLILIDEPELGLHPAAITVLANMLESAAIQTQVIVATQSVTLVNQFTPEDVWTVDREDGQSVFRQLSNANQQEWLDQYALGEMWEKNLLGARP